MKEREHMEDLVLDGLFLCFCCNSLPVGQGLLIIKASGLHYETLHSVGLLWTRDQSDAEITT